MKPSFMKKNVKFSEIRENKKWRVNLLKEIVNMKQNTLDLKNDDNDAFLTGEQLNDILEYVSTS